MEGVSKGMNITKRLEELDPSLVLHNEGHWEVPYDQDYPGYSSFNDAGVETEVGEFLYAMTRILKPDEVLETGTHWGVSACYIGQALKNNNAGTLTTIEFSQDNYMKACKRFKDIGLLTTGAVSGWVNPILMDIANFTTTKNYKLILLDTEPQIRFAELLKFYDNLEFGGYLFIHDLHQHMHQIENTEHGFAWPFGLVPKELKKLVTDGKLRPFHFETPRGLTGFYKVHPNDYKWSE